MKLLALVFLTPVYEPRLAVAIVVIGSLLALVLGASKSAIAKVLMWLAVFWTVSLVTVVAFLWYAFRNYQF